MRLWRYQCFVVKSFQRGLNHRLLLHRVLFISMTEQRSQPMREDIAYVTASATGSNPTQSLIVDPYVSMRQMLLPIDQVLVRSESARWWIVTYQTSVHISNIMRLKGHFLSNPSGFLYLYCRDCTIILVPVKPPWRIWVNTLRKSHEDRNIGQNCVHFLRNVLYVGRDGRATIQLFGVERIWNCQEARMW